MGIELNEKLKKNNKFIISISLLLLFLIFFYYRVVFEIRYTSDYETMGIITKMEIEEDGEGFNNYNLEITYEDSEKNKVIDTHLVHKSSTEYKILEILNINVGSEIKIQTEEGFAEGFLGKRFLFSEITSILMYNE
ncbi:hypothetical protein [Clostridium sp.]|uniref:hypothetical protein n=1 Tax=Clostridium sp. TaxID=1506 RepID=UPI003F30F740